MISRLKLLILLMAAPTAALTQNLTGTWEGRSGSEFCRLVIVQINDSCFGFTYDEGFGHCKANYIGKYDPQTKDLDGLNTSFIDRNIMHSLSVYNLTYSVKDGSEYLRGRIKAKTTGAKIMSMGIPQTIWYKRVSEQVDTTKLMAAKISIYQKEIQPVVVNKEETKLTGLKPDTASLVKNEVPADLQSVKASRTSVLVKSLETLADSMRLQLYDNGEVDGDTVTVFYNGSVIFNRVPLTVKALEILLPVEKGLTNSIELVANNLGSIPPNTALLLVYAGAERHELRVSSDFSTNARIDIIHLIKRP